MSTGLIMCSYKNESLVKAGSVLLFLPALKGKSHFVLNCDNSEGSSSIVFSYCYDFVVCQCVDIMKGVRIKKKMEALDIKNVYIVIAEVNCFPYKNQTFSLTIFQNNFLSISLSKRICEIFIKKAEEILRVSCKDCMAYLGFQFSGSFMRQATQKLILFHKLFFGKQIINYSYLMVNFQYISYEKLYFLKGIPLDKNLSLVNFIFFVKRTMFGNNIGFLISNDKSRQECLKLFERIKQQIESKYNLKLKELKCVRVGSGGSLIADFNEVIIRVPLSQDAEACAERNFCALEILCGKELPFTTPRPVTREVIDGLLVYCESKLDGISLDIDKKSLHSKKKWLINRSFEMLADKSLVLDTQYLDNAFINIIDEPCRNLRAFMSEAEKKIFANALNLIKITLKIYRPPFVITHGDFKSSNFIINQIDPEAKIGLIDWESVGIPGLPFCDLLRFMNNEINGWVDDNEDLITLVWSFVNREYPHELIERYCHSLQISITLLPSITILFFVYHINNHYKEIMSTSFSYRQRIISGKFIPVLQDYMAHQRLEPQDRIGRGSS